MSAIHQHIQVFFHENLKQDWAILNIKIFSL